MFSGLLLKDLFKRKWKFGKKLFQAKLLSRLSHKVCRLLSPPVLLRKFTISDDDGDGNENGQKVIGLD